MHLEKASAGAVKNESNEPASSQLGKKRAREDETKATTLKKKKDQTQGGLTSETLQKEITEHQIGKIVGESRKPYMQSTAWPPICCEVN